MNDLISRKWLMECVNEGWIKFDTEKDKNIYVHLVRDIAPSAQLERPEQPESAREYCAECNHIEMCRWYPYEGCEFRSLPSAQPETHDKRTETHECDLISRQAAIVVFENSGLDDDSKDTVVRVLEQLPPAQSQRKKGKWIILPPIFEEICQCSNCKMKFKDALQWTNYCPNCRADMRGDSE